jgi:hypothetical protein
MAEVGRVLPIFLLTLIGFPLSRVYWFGPSLLLSGTMTAADFLPFVVTAFAGWQDLLG